MSDMTIQNAIHCMKAMLCEEVCEECDYYGKTGTDHCEADAVRMAIKALEEQPRWIPFAEMMPAFGESVLVQFDDDDMDILTFPNIYKKLKRVAWMPLPEPYKRGERNA